MDIITILNDGVIKRASDIFIVAGRPISYRIDNEIIAIDDTKILPDESKQLVQQLFEMSNSRSQKVMDESGSDDFSFAINSLSRFRVSAYFQRGSYAAVVRIIQFELPNPKNIGISDNVLKLAYEHNGLVLIVGPAGNGKSTTMACIIDKINSELNKHIITIEDPLEYLHKHKKSIVSQREINTDVIDYLAALKSSLRQSPNVILLGEMRDYETIDVALTAAETGHLVFSSLHTMGASNTISRIIGVFPSSDKQQVAFQLALSLRAVVSQQLVPAIDGKLIPVFEIMMVTPAIRNLIRENKIHQIDNIISSSISEDMVSMEYALIKLYKEGKITKATAINYAPNAETIKKKID
ncbi:MAG: PilT/PilU family type 4a pilus ATPase [Erysipelotrichaceae bacterium]